MPLSSSVDVEKISPLERSGGRVHLIGGDFYYSPNSQRNVQLPPVYNLNDILYPSRTFPVSHIMIDVVPDSVPISLFVLYGTPSQLAPWSLVLIKRSGASEPCPPSSYSHLLCFSSASLPHRNLKRLSLSTRACQWWWLHFDPLINHDDSVAQLAGFSRPSRKSQFQTTLYFGLNSPDNSICFLQV